MRACVLTVLAFFLSACSAASDPPSTDANQPASPEPPEPPTMPTKPPPPDSVPGDPGDGTRLNPETAGVGTERLVAAFPERIGDWVRTDSREHPAGAAGRWADGAGATYRNGERELRADVTDMIRVQTGDPGMAAKIRAEALAADPTSKQVEVGKQVGVVRPGSLEIWLGDRCQLAIASEGASNEELATVAAGLGLEALAVVCAEREGVPGSRPR